ncbi:MAG: hypothetical protein AAFR47_02230 [Pseudomonadota bacterium]
MADEETQADDTTEATSTEADTAQSDKQAEAAEQDTSDASKSDDAAASKDSPWPDDWRDRLSKGDEKTAARLRRFASPDNLVRALMEQDKKISAGAFKAALPENPSDKEIADYRKAHGVPDEGTAEAYGLKFAEGVEVTEAQTAQLNAFAAEAHKQNVPPAAVNSLWAWYQGQNETMEQAAYDAAQLKTEESRVELRTEYGKEYKRHTQMADNFMAKHGGEKAAEIVGLTLADGTKLGDHPDFVRMMVNASLATSDDAALVTADLASGENLDGAYQAALDLKFTDSKKYHSPEHQEKLKRMAAAKAKRQAA